MIVASVRMFVLLIVPVVISCFAGNVKGSIPLRPDTAIKTNAAKIKGTKVPDKLIVLTFDDAILTHYTHVAPLLKKYGFTATFFVCEFEKPPFSDTTKYLTWTKIAALNKMGFEIGNHTWHHQHVNKLDKNQFTAELEYIEKQCALYNIPKPVSFAYPGYDTSSRAVAVLKAKGYRFARAGFDRTYDPEKDNPFLIPGFTTLAGNKQLIMNAIDQAENGQVSVLTIHGVPDEVHPWVNTPLDLFEEYLIYLKKNHYKVIAMRDLARYLKQ